MCFNRLKILKPDWLLTTAVNHKMTEAVKLPHEEEDDEDDDDDEQPAARSCRFLWLWHKQSFHKALETNTVWISTDPNSSETGLGASASTSYQSREEEEEWRLRPRDTIFRCHFQRLFGLAAQTLDSPGEREWPWSDDLIQNYISTIHTNLIWPKA